AGRWRLSGVPRAGPSGGSAAGEHEAFENLPAVANRVLYGAGAHGWADQVTLDMVAARFHHLLELLGRLDAFGGDGHADGLAEIGDGAQEGGIGAVLRLQERAVELDGVDGQVAQVREGRVTSAEIIEADRHAPRPQLGQQLRAAGPIDEGGGLGDPEIEPVGRHAGEGERALDPADGTAATQLEAREGAGGPRPRKAACLPARPRLAG